MASIFFSYCHKDEALRDQLETHLALLRRQGLITAWHDRRIMPGDEFDESISTALDQAEVILLLVSAEFLNSTYCYSREMSRAMERHEGGEARVIPVILRDCDWHSAPFGKLNALPKDAKPLTLWPDHDQAFASVAREIRRVVESRTTRPAATPTRTQPAAPTPSRPAGQAAPRSSNLSLPKVFSEQDQDRFLRQGFEFIARFFENSLQALEERNPGVEGSFERIDGRRLVAIVYRDGKKVAGCSIRIDGMARSDGIAYSQGTSAQDGSFNELLTVGSSPQALYFKSMGFNARGGERDQQLSHEGAAELLWENLIGQLR